MPRVDIALWRVDSVVLPNGTPQQKLDSLRDQIDLAFQHKPASDLRIFAVAEFYFMNANKGESGIRWYTKSEKDTVVNGLLALSRSHGGILLVGGTVCWAETKKKVRLSKRTHWHVYNEAPVAYNGVLLNMHRKRYGGGETGGSDNLRLYQARRGNIDRTVTVRAQQDNPDGTARYEQRTDDRPLDDIHTLSGSTIKGGTEAAAPGIKAASERYEDRIHFESGTGSGGFRLADLNLTGGVEVCQDHNQEVLKTTLPQPCNLHILVSNTVGYKESSVYLANPGLFVHCDPGNKARAVLNNGALVEVDDGQWHTANKLALLTVNV
jgi:hypothetical protein